eukprot:281073-Amphidinium_carterae.1
MWWILPIPLKNQRSKLPKISPNKRSDEQVSMWTDARPAGVVGLYADDALVGPLLKNKKGMPGSHSKTRILLMVQRVGKF